MVAVVEGGHLGLLFRVGVAYEGWRVPIGLVLFRVVGWLQISVNPEGNGIDSNQRILMTLVF